jgi:glycosyltransferase involved in cell wall biosynthesis
VVVPTYGGQRVLPTLVDRLRKALDGESFEIILVHDCGPDESWATISELAKADNRIRGINLRKNFGQHNSVDVAHQERSNGESQYTLRKSISLLLKMATSGSIFPLRLASLLGLLTSFVGFILALVFAIQRIEDPTLPIGWASLIVTSLFLGGVQLLALGILGEYIGGLFLRVDARPQCVIADITDVRAKASEGQERSASRQ